MGLAHKVSLTTSLVWNLMKLFMVVPEFLEICSSFGQEDGDKAVDAFEVKRRRSTVRSHSQVDVQLPQLL